ncbi:MAG: GNAT family N-acetyltransferase [Deltaproteobacteria bacterium]|nr:GNAT family N-acetyltransferase [Deltaproteobacteria bacterium]
MDNSTLPAGSFLRPAQLADVPLLLEFIRKLAAYEKLSDRVKTTEGDLRAHLFGPRPYAEAILIEVDGEPVGFALFFHNYSTFAGKPGLFLEDVFVDPEYRGRGLGRAVMVHLARLAVMRGCARFEWSVLDWNAPSIAFYKGLGAVPLDEWTGYRLDGDALRALAGRTEGN